MAEPSVKELKQRIAETFAEARKDGTLQKLEDVAVAVGEKDENVPIYRCNEGKTELYYDARVRYLRVTVDGAEVLSTADSKPKFIKRGPWLEALLKKLPKAEADAAERKELLGMLDEPKKEVRSGA